MTTAPLEPETEAVRQWRDRAHRIIVHAVEEHVGRPVNGLAAPLMLGLVRVTEELVPQSETSGLLIAAEVAKQRHSVACVNLRRIANALRPLTFTRQTEREAAVARIMDRDHLSKSAADKVTHTDEVYAALVQKIERLELDQQAAQHEVTQARMEFDYAVTLLRLLPALSGEAR